MLRKLTKNCVSIGLALALAFSAMAFGRWSAARTVMAASGSTAAVDPTGKGDGYSTVLYDNTNGLPTSEANAVAETPDGFIWIGSYSGLTRYDGRSFERIDSTTGISSVVSLFVDSKGRLWIGTNDNGVAVMEKGSCQIFNHKTGLRSSSVRAIVEDTDGIIYIATTQGIAKIDSENKLGQLDDPKINDEYINTTSELIKAINTIYSKFDDYLLAEDFDLNTIQQTIESVQQALNSKANLSDIPTQISQFSDYNNMATKYYVDTHIENATLNAYEIYVRNGGELSESAWLESLHGADGQPGKSAYELARQYGLTTDTEYVWLQSLQGRDGFSAYDIAKSLDPNIGTQTEWIESLKGADGEQGPRGKSAYEIYHDLQIDLGNEPLNEQDWINSLSQANTYTAGTNITIENNVISAMVTPESTWNIINS